MTSPFEVVDAELVEEGWLPAIPEDRTPAVLQVDEDPDAWLPPEAQADVEAGIPKDTTRAYKGDMERFAAWCEQVGRRVMPAAPQTVTAYLSYLKRTPREKTGRPYGPATMDRIIASIRSSHRAAGYKPPDTMGARKVVAGYREELSLAQDPAATQQKATAADRGVLREALSHLDRATLVGKRDAALMLLGHAIASRGSELAPLNWPASFTDLPKGGFAVKVYRKKRKKWQSVEVVPDPDPALCTVTAVRGLVTALAHEGHHTGPLFMRIDQWGYMGAEMTRGGEPIGDPAGRISIDGASDVVSRSIHRTGLPGKWTSHSLRRGFVKTARAADADIVDIGRHGGWDDRSKALVGYIDEEDSQGERNPLTQIAKKAADRAKEQST